MVRRVLLVLLGVVLLGVAGVAVVWVRLPSAELAVVSPGGFTVAEGVSGAYAVGPVTVRVTDGARARVRIRRDGHLVWSSPPGTAWLTAARGQVEYAEHRGYFWPRVEHTRVFADQQLTGVERRDGALVLHSRLTGDGQPTREAPVRAVVRVSPRAGGGVDVRVRVTRGEVDALQWVTGRSPGAGVHGFGEQFMEWDLSGRLIPILVREQGVGRGAQPLTFLADVTNHGAGGTLRMTYAAWSRFVTDDLRGVRLDPAVRASHAFAVADTRHPRRVGLEVWADTLALELVAGQTPVQLLKRQDSAGMPPRLAAWTQQGAIVGIQGGTRKVRRVVDRLLAADAEVAAVWIQDWTGQRTTGFGQRLWWTWQLDTERYPGWADLVADLRAQGIRTTTYVNPKLVDARAKGDAVADGEIRNLWAQALRRGFLVENDHGEPLMVDQGGFDASLVDLSDPDAREWYARMIARYVLADGVVGFMADFGEGLPMDAHIENGDPRVQHNRWPLLWARTVRRACEIAGQPDCVTWLRAGSLGSGEVTPLFWNGDQMVTDSTEDGLASALRGTLHAGVSGWPLVHSDVGGYTSVDAVLWEYTRSSALLARWGEYAAFGPVMRTHETNRPAANLQSYDPRQVETFARSTRIFAALAEYRRPYLRAARRHALPVVRPVWLHYPDTPAAETGGQFLLGEYVLVAPVLDVGDTETVDTVEVTFPPGRWRHLITGEVYRGGRTVTVTAPIGRPAAFVDTDYPRARQLVRRVRAAVQASGR